MIKIFDFNYDAFEACAKFKVDTEKFKAEDAKVLLDFFSWDYDADADPIEELMKKYAKQAILIATREQLDTHGVILEFNQQEGFASIDGSVGIKLLDVDKLVFHEDRMEMEILEVDATKAS